MNDAFFVNKAGEKAFQHFKAFAKKFANFFFFRSFIRKVLMGFSIVFEV